MAGTVLESWWCHLVDMYGEKNLATVGTFVFHEVAYFGWYIPYFIIDSVPMLNKMFRKYKVQPDKVNTWGMQWNCFYKLVLTHIFFQLPMMMMFHFVAPLIGIEVGKEGFPTIGKIAMMTVLSFIIEDFYFYWIHRFLHWGFWYKYIHKVHHLHAAPFGMAAEYAHPMETMFLGLGTILGPLLFANHVVEIYIYLFFRLFQTIEAHVGYELPISPSKWLPLWSGAEFHDFHHETFTGNYSSSFIIWDWMFGTDQKYRQRKAMEKKKKVL